MKRIVLTLLVAVALAGGLSACGKKGPPQPPPAEEERERR